MSRPALATAAALVLGVACLSGCATTGSGSVGQTVQAGETQGLGAANATFAVAEKALALAISDGVVTGATETSLVALARKCRAALDTGDAVQAQSLAAQLQTAINAIIGKAGQ